MNTNNYVFADKMGSSLQLFLGKKAKCKIDLLKLSDSERTELEYNYEMALKKISQIELTVITDGTHNKRWIKSDPIPDGWHIGSCRKYDKQPDYIQITNGIRTTKILRKEPIPDGWWQGTHLKGQITITNGQIDKRIFKNEPIPTGFYKGSIYKRSANKVWITNGIKSTYIKKTDLLPNGWWYGHTFRSVPVGSIFITNGNERLF